MSQESTSSTKWTCEYCTYENYQNALKCTMCRGAKPLLGEDIYRLREEAPAISDASGPSVIDNSGKWSCEMCTFLNVPKAKECGQCRTQRHPVTVSTIHDQFRALKICDSDSVASASNKAKWSCTTCTYENWPRSKKCTMCGAHAPNRISPAPSSNAIKISSPERDANYLRASINEDHSLISLKSLRREDIVNSANSFDSERRRLKADYLWLNACLGVVQGDPRAVERFLNSGGDPTRQLTAGEVALLNRPSAFDVGYTLVHLAIRFHREEMLATLVSGIEGGGSGLKRVPSYVAPELASAIRKHATSNFITKHSRSLPFPYVTEFATFMLPAEIEDLPPLIQEQLFEELLDRDVQQQLENEPAVINWSIEVTVHLGSRLYALWNRSQGDCLLDSLMQVTYGVFDRDNLLRKALADTLNHGGHLLYPRWYEYEMSQARQLEFTLSESQWAEDWSALVKRATQPGASLQQLHVFALAHVLRRPIIVYGVKFVKSFRGEDIGYAGFEGVYLPLLWEPSFCSTSPVALGYTRGHFSALVPIEPYPPSESTANNIPDDNLQVTFLPLVDKDRKVLPIHFINKAEMGSEERLLRQWLDVNGTANGLLVAQQKCQTRPLLVAQMLEEWLNHYRRLAQMATNPYSRNVPANADFSSEGDTDDE